MSNKHINVYAASSPEVSDDEWVQSVHEPFEGAGYKTAAKNIREERALGVPQGVTQYVRVTVEEEDKDELLFDETEPVEGTQE